MRRKELVIEVAERTDLRRETVERVLQGFATVAAEALLEGQDVPLGWDLGKLIVLKKKGLKVYFKPSRAFKEARDNK